MERGERFFVSLSGSEEFLDLVVLVGGGLGELAKIPLDNIVAVRGGGCQVFEIGVEVFG